MIEEGNTAELKSKNALTQRPMGNQGGANSGEGDIVKNPISREQTPLGEADNKRRDRSHSPRPATSSTFDDMSGDSRHVGNFVIVV